MSSSPFPNITISFLLAFHMRIAYKEVERWSFSCLCTLSIWPSAWPTGLEFSFFIKNTIFSELSHTLSKIMINAIVAHTVLELLLLPRKRLLLPTLPQREHTAPQRQAGGQQLEFKSKAAWVINSHAVLFPLPTLQDHISQPLGSEESWN